MTMTATKRNRLGPPLTSDGVRIRKGMRVFEVFTQDAGKSWHVIDRQVYKTQRGAGGVMLVGLRFWNMTRMGRNAFWSTQEAAASEAKRLTRWWKEFNRK